MRRGQDRAVRTALAVINRAARATPGARQRRACPSDRVAESGRAVASRSMFLGCCAAATARPSRGQTDCSRNLIDDFSSDASPGSPVVFDRLGHDDQPLCAGNWVGGAESHDATLANTFDVRCDLFDFMGIEVAASLEDDVFVRPVMKNSPSAR